MTKDEVTQFFKDKGLKQDAFGHFVKTREDGTKIRYKMGKLAVRYEVKSQSGWVRMRSGYYKSLTVEPTSVLPAEGHWPPERPKVLKGLTR